MKRNYERPCMMVETFEASEYVATCYRVKCDIGMEYKNLYEDTKINGIYDPGEDKLLGSISRCEEEVTINIDKIGSCLAVKNSNQSQMVNYWQDGILGTYHATSTPRESWISAGNHS